jgi:(5-formylfuran-3-yl)methyl phosphate synthase
VTELLISVRNTTEAQTVLKTVPHLAILDIKEPRLGALSATSPETWQNVAALDRGSTLLSVALGELSEYDLATSKQIPAATRYAKIGLSQQAAKNWVDPWQRTASSLPHNTDLVGVIYADHQTAQSPPADCIIDTLMTIGCRTFLIDTYDKSKGNVLHHLSRAAIANLNNQIEQQDGTLVLAGSITSIILADILQTGAKYIGIRGAVCEGDRQNQLSQNATISFLSSLKLLSPGI